MKLSTRTRTLPIGVALAGTLALSACGAANEQGGTAGGGAGGGGEVSGTLVGAGASSQEAAMQGWRAGYTEVQPGVTVNYDPVGSGGGREQFLAGGTDFAGSDAPLDEEELAQAEERCGSAGVFELPNYISPIAVAYNLQGVDALNLSPVTLAGIFAQQITSWNDPAIAADNPDVQLPDLPITPVNRSDESGTTENFAEYLATVAPDVWTYEVSGDWPVPGGEAAQGTSGVVSAIGAGEGTIGYADLSQVEGLGVASVGVGPEFVAPTAEAAAAVVENSETLEGRGEYDFAIELARDTAESGNYPIVLISYHIGCIEYADQETATLVQDFMGYVVSADGQEAAAEAAGSAPISDTLRGQAQRAIDAITAAAG
ncbi:phosphate ABC transporter substrate-binding protein PstS [Geodermatophilus sp. YIM 151500]|uniref:phosphate ABC transporter substrate-binding protein PstS n=1 Tax=Geodermatophilus sp. YIM 151500 TaxID=2984531 RepID=UPI0021E4641D|nr:phosphate ABC transporter substrate-binding protein PstS [Geodermatophilus sp. YIM 151500]MCV2490356.1 phosphate ABC transporter substrate-binding protein PstS [Geodermatophilus sp. YIM 151500]